MTETTALLVYGAAVPAGVAMVVRGLVPRLFAEDMARRYAAASALGLGFLAGYLLSNPIAALAPGRHWQWLPYLALASMVIGPVGVADGVRRGERLLLQLLMAVVAAWFLAPAWAKPSRGVQVAGLAGGLFLLMAALEPLPARLRGGRIVPAMLVLASASVAVLTALSVSLTYGQLAALPAAALGGWAVASLAGDGETNIRGLVPAYAVLAGGSAYVGFVEPDPYMAGLLVAAIAPLGLWACAFGPLSRLKGAAAIAVQTVAVLVPLAIAAALIILGEEAGAEGY